MPLPVQSREVSLMAIIRKVFGPFHPENIHPGTQAEELRWHFIGIKDDKTTAHWTLVFDPRKRTYRVNNNTSSGGLIGRSRKALIAQKIDPGVKGETAHPDAWLDDSPVMEGTITSILKSKLSPEDIARATALVIARR